jgi:hypothetical protein
MISFYFTDQINDHYDGGEGDGELLHDLVFLCYGLALRRLLFVEKSVF